jgi:putative ABC transport system permease protein
VTARVYRLLLRAYPRRFRERFGAEMEATWAERRAEPGGAARLWLVTVVDTLAGGVAERLRFAKEDDMGSLWQDVRFALRALARRPGFSFVAVATLALAIGANTAIFSLFNAMLLRPLPWKDPDRLVMAWTQARGAPQRATSYPLFRDWREQAKTLADVAAFRGQTVSLVGDGEPEPLPGAFVSASFHPMLGTTMGLGRGFLPEETEPGTARPVVILSDGLWRRRFGGDPAILGRTLVLNGNPRTVIGVLGPDWAPGRAPNDGWFMATDVWLPATDFPNAGGFERTSYEFLVVARLADGATPAAAAAELGAIARRAGDPALTGAEVVPVHEQIAGDTRPALLLLLGAVGMLLLIASTNVAALLVARGAQRRKEIAVRAALGAGRARLVRLLFSESALIVLAGGALGVLAAAVLADALRAIVPVGASAPDRLALDRSVLAYAAAMTAAAALVAGLVPALQASRSDLMGVIKAQDVRARGRVRDALIVAEGALSVILLVAAGVLVRSAVALARVDPGFAPERVLAAELRLPPARYRTPEQIATFFDQTLARLRAIPGASAAALARAVPFGGNDGSGKMQIVGREVPAGQEPVVAMNLVSEGYFGAMGIPLVRGRDFTRADALGTPGVAIVSAHLAARFFPGEDPLGKTIRTDDGTFAIVGVAADSKHGSLEAEPRLQVFEPTRQAPKIFTGVVVRATGDPAALAGALKQAIWSVDPSQPVWKVKTMVELVDRARRGAGALGLLVGLFAAVAVVLATIGIYGVMSYATVQRRREIGIRVALGAPAGRVVWELLRRGAGLAALAALLGCAGAAALGRILGLTFFGVAPLDPASFAGAAALLMAASTLASFLPARRAARVDPMIVLGSEG